MTCPYCNTDNRDGARFCSNCGKNMEEQLVFDENTRSTSRSLTVGARLQGGRYVVKKVLGEGGMGTALLATDNRLDGKAVVIKELLSENADPVRRQDDVRNFKREVATLAHIDHPLVPNVTDHFQEGTRYFMVQEYVEGENFEEILGAQGAPLRERDVLIYAVQLLDVLDYLSQQMPPIVHRDIKPANSILGARDKRAHLVDFGIARADEAKNARLKQTSALGTPGYCPPEQYQGNADPRSDLYALAATLHHLLTNRDPRHHPPFHYPAVRSLNPSLTPDIERILARVLQNDPDQRYQSASSMKQDIEMILHTRFGISDNVDSYTLGATGSSPALPAFPTLAQQQTQVVAAPATPAQSLPGLFAYQPALTPYPGGRRSTRRVGLWGSLIVLIIIIGLLLSGGIFFFVNQTGSTSGLGTTQIGNEQIGVSDGGAAFDTSLPDGSLKAQAANAWQQNKNSPNSALSLLSQALTMSSNDAEALIYQENISVVTSGHPYVTIAIATMLTGNSSLVAVGRDDLQGAYVAQKEFNDAAKLHGGVLVHLLIANAGGSKDYVTQVAQRLVHVAQSDQTFVGVVGWPYSSYTQVAVPVLAAAHIPLISQTASSDALTDSSPYFFRVVPPNSVQATEGATYAEKQLHAKRVALFYDPSDPYSDTLGEDFMHSFVADGNQIVATEKYTIGQPSSFPGQIQDALAHKPDLIYFSGYASDVSALLVNLPSGNLSVLGGDALYELGGYQSSARVNFSRLRFTAFAYPDEWEVFGLAARQPAFFAEYSAAYNANGQHPAGVYGFTRPDNDVILSYDAMITLLNASNTVLLSGQKLTSQALQGGLKGINRAHAIQGVSGQISFGSKNDPIDKTIVLLHVSSGGDIQQEPSMLGSFLK